MLETLTGGPTGPGSPLSPYRRTQERIKVRFHQQQQIKKANAETRIITTK